MAKINILPSKVYNRIAAGEVVDRPYSVVKELVENSIDAGATEIEIHVDKGGKELIRVIDNGCGIEMEDLHSAFLPHATSKIEKAEPSGKDMFARADTKPRVERRGGDTRPHHRCQHHPPTLKDRHVRFIHCHTLRIWLWLPRLNARTTSSSLRY